MLSLLSFAKLRYLTRNNQKDALTERRREEGGYLKHVNTVVGFGRVRFIRANEFVLCNTVFLLVPVVGCDLSLQNLRKCLLWRKRAS